MTRDDAQNPQWFTSSYSNDQGGQCVEAARMGNGTARKMWVRDSKAPAGPVFEFDHGPWQHFVQAVVDGEIRHRNM
ncbi:DUF397 domain-containing protein [Streptomyces sp. NPDC006270]|uniref:DUF397 domain-containing protein n=1 Tax=Streptomyces sp. NPDC006270 TaxID=3364741 RepID=UPI003694EE4D